MANAAVLKTAGPQGPYRFESCALRRTIGAVVLALAACGGNDSGPVVPSGPFAAQYALVSVDGGALPRQVAGPVRTRSVIADTVAFFTSGAVRERHYTVEDGQVLGFADYAVVSRGVLVISSDQFVNPINGAATIGGRTLTVGSTEGSRYGLHTWVYAETPMTLTETPLPVVR
jgi:hypothetical protein